jgi:N-acetylglucosamine malate deacetylase 1
MSATSPPARILAIHAHPDDVEFQCAGTLALLGQRGCELVIATMTPGDKGSDELSRREIAEIRRGEARAAAELLGAEYVCLEFSDLEIVVDNLSRRRVTEAVRRARPDVVLTAPPVDYMSDHEMTSRLVRDALFAAPARNYDTEVVDAAPPLARIPHIYYVDALEHVDLFGRPLDPDFVVDVTPVIDLKRRMVACHESQRAWLLKQHGLDDYTNSVEASCRKRGAEIGVAYGEGFRQHVGHPYPHGNRLLELLGVETARDTNAVAGR